MQGLEKDCPSGLKSLFSLWWKDRIREPLRKWRGRTSVTPPLEWRSPGVLLTVAPEPERDPRPADWAPPRPGRSILLDEATSQRIHPHPLSVHSTRAERHWFEDREAYSEELRIATLDPHFWFPEQGYVIDPEGWLSPYTIVARSFDPQLQATGFVESHGEGGEPSPSLYFHPEALALAPKVSGERLIVSHFPTYNYGHFLIDMAPLIDFGVQAGLKMVARPLLPWQREVLGLMGVRPKAFAEYRQNCIRLQRPILSNYHNAVATRAFNAAHLEIYRRLGRAARQGGAAGPAKIFLCRDESSSRSIANRRQLAEALRGLGYAPVQPGKLSFFEQVTLFAEVEFIVAEFGAALVNLLFAPKAKRVVEIIPEGQDDPWSVNLCAALGIEHVVLFEKNDRPEPVDGVINNDFEYEVDIPRLLTTLKQL